jgi:hypothetical protein
VRLQVPGVLALEVWDLPVAGKLLQEWRDDPSFARYLASAVRALIASPPAAFTPLARGAASRIAHVHLIGGAVDDAMCAALHLPCSSTRDPFAAARAGTALLPGAACADIGQTAIKLVDGAHARSVPRDRAHAPPRDSVPLPRDRARASTIRWLASLLGALGAPQVVVGLPCELTGDGIPRSCSYCWPDPDPALVPELEQISGKALAILNDAELAAVAAAPHVPDDVVTLVLTIGFGVGGALLTERRARGL